MMHSRTGRNSMSKRVDRFKNEILAQPEGMSKKQIKEELAQAPYCQQLNRLAFLVDRPSNFSSMRFDYSTHVVVPRVPDNNETTKSKSKKDKIKKTESHKTEKKKSKKSNVASKQEQLVLKPSRTSNQTEEASLSEFSLWLNQLNRKESDMAKSPKKSSPKDKANSKKKKKKQKSALKKKIQASLDKNTDIASEQLAELYVKQGHIKKAIKCYKQLRLNNPQKSSYFAARIEQLKQSS